MTRLFLPLGSTGWPQRTHLSLDQGQTTLKVARGDSFTLSVKVRPGDEIPESAQVTYQFADGDSSASRFARSKGASFAAGSIRSTSRSASR